MRGNAISELPVKILSLPFAPTTSISYKKGILGKFGHGDNTHSSPYVTQTSRPFLGHRCSQDDDPGVCILTPGLLQLTVLPHLRPLDTTTTSGSERCGTSRYWYAEARSYQPSPSAAALVTSSPAYKV